ncbi:MAG: hypothetical protein R3F34_05075 [Planctomycetota bacterium]
MLSTILRGAALAATLLLVARSHAAVVPSEDDPLAALAARIEASTSPVERSALARYGRRRDRGGSLWWFEVEARSAMEAGEHAAAVRICTDALRNPLRDEDRAVLHVLRAGAFEQLRELDQAFTDLAAAASFDPARPELEERLHAVLATRLETRRIARDRRAAEALLAGRPDDPHARLRLARVLAEAGELDGAIESYEYASFGAPEALAPSDWLSAARCAEASEAAGLAVTFLRGAKEQFEQLDVAEWIARLERRVDEQTLTDIGYLGYLGYDEDPDPTDEPTGPPEALEPSELERRVAQHEATIDALFEREGTLLDGYWAGTNELDELEARLAGTSDRATIAAERSAAAAIADRLDAWWKDFAEFGERRASVESFVDAWLPWLQSLDESHALAEIAERVASLRNGLYALPDFAIDDPRERARSAVDTRIAQLEAQERWEREASQLAAATDLPAAERAGRARVLLESGRATPDLLAVLGLALLELGDTDRALAPLHLSLASIRPGVRADEVRARLDELRGEAETLASAARSALDAGRPDQARPLADRAISLAPLDGHYRALEADCLAALLELDAALVARRIATGLDTARRGDEDVTGLRAHVDLALRARRLSEALEVADLLLDIAPRDPDVLELRAEVLALCDRIDEARQLRRQAWERLGYDAELTTTEEWPKWLGAESHFAKREWRDGDAGRAGSMLPWRPEADLSAAVSTRLLAALRGHLSAAELATPIDGMTARDRAEWRGVSAFMAGELSLLAGNADAAAVAYRRALRDDATPILVARLAASRIGAGAGRDGGLWHLPLLVPFDRPDLDGAQDRARYGRTILLGPGQYAIEEPLKNGVRIVGAGPDVTTLVLRSDRVVTDVGASVELADLEVQRYGGAGDADELAAKGRLVVERGSLRLERCALDGTCGFQVASGAALEIVDSDLTGTTRAPIASDGGLVVLDGVVLDRAIAVRGGELLADRVTLLEEARVVSRGARVAIGHVAVDVDAGVALDVDGSGSFGVERCVWRTRSDTSLATGPAVAIGELLVVGDPAVAHGATVATLDLVDAGTAARAQQPVLVANTSELLAALASGASHIHLEPGTYGVDGRKLEHDVVLVGRVDFGEGPRLGYTRFQRGYELRGVRLEVRADRADHVFEVPDGVTLVLDTVQLAVGYSQAPPAGSSIEKLGGVIAVDQKFSRYPLLRVAGTVVLERAGQQQQSAGDRDAEQLVADVAEGGRLVSFALETGRGLHARGGSRVELVDGAVDILVLDDAARVDASGRSELERLEVSGPSAVVALHDVRPQRLEFAAFRRGAPDPRSDLRRRYDGGDPVELRMTLIEESRERWIAPLTGVDDDRAWARALAAYGMGYARAAELTEPRERKVYDAAAREVLSYLGDDAPRMCATIESTHEHYSGYRLADALYRNMDRGLYERVIAENRALHELGEGASQEDLEFLATWEEAVLKGLATREELNDGRSLGMSPIAYRAEMTRRAAEAARLEEAAQVAIAGGDPQAVKEALLAIDRDRWLEHVLYDDYATLDDVTDALAVGGSSKLVYYLEHKQRRLQWDLERSMRSSGGGGAWSIGTSGGGSTDYSTPGFDTWVKQSNTWNRDFDNWMSSFQSSSYSNYRNDYNY